MIDEALKEFVAKRKARRRRSGILGRDLSRSGIRTAVLVCLPPVRFKPGAGDII